MCDLDVNLTRLLFSLQNIQITTIGHVTDGWDFLLEMGKSKSRKSVI
jgi:hypothetical protein